MTVVVASVLAAGALAPAASAHPAPVAVPASESRARAAPPLTDDRGRTLTLRGWNVEDKANREAVDTLNRYSSGWAGYVWCYGGGYCAVDERGRFRTNKERTATPYAPAVAGTVRSEAYDADTRSYRLAYRAAAGPGATELSLPPTPRGWRVSVTGPGLVAGGPGTSSRGSWPVVRAWPGGEVVVTMREGGPYGRTDHP